MNGRTGLPANLSARTTDATGDPSRRPLASGPSIDDFLSRETATTHIEPSEDHS